MDDRPGSLELHDPVPVNVPVRESLSQLLKLPFWGWGEEKVAFVWTIDLATKFVKDGRVIWVDVDAATGRILGRSRP